jgi:GT2 family glycosyltransferase
MPYGDQALFIKASAFKRIGGFPEIPIMEDFELIRRLRRLGKINIIPMPVLTSARRWQKLGVLKTTLINQLTILAYFLGISPERLARWYRRDRGNS